MQPILSGVIVTSLLLPLQRSDTRQTESDEQKSARQLEFMKRSAAVYDVLAGPSLRTRYTLQREPLLRWTNPVSGVTDGTIFIWRAANGRPEIIAQVFVLPGGIWLHEFQSLSTDVFTMQRNGRTIWSPRKPGIKFSDAPDAPAPASSKIGRLVQMRAMAREYSASDEFEGKSRWELRLMSKPLDRYGKAGTDLLDGAIFALAHGTDPEMLVVFEARRHKGAYKWQVGLAPMTAYAVHVSRKGRVVWRCSWRKPPYDPQEPFFGCDYHPEE